MASSLPTPDLFGVIIGAAARAAAEAHRQHITRWFSTARTSCTAAWPRCTSRTSGSASTLTRVAPGLAQYVHDAMLANACPTLPVQDARSTAIPRLPLLVALVATLVGGCGDDSDGPARVAGNSPCTASQSGDLSGQWGADFADGVGVRQGRWALTFNDGTATLTNQQGESGPGPQPITEKADGQFQLSADPGCPISRR